MSNIYLIYILFIIYFIILLKTPKSSLRPGFVLFLGLNNLRLNETLYFYKKSKIKITNVSW